MFSHLHATASHGKASMNLVLGVSLLGALVGTAFQASAAALMSATPLSDDGARTTREMDAETRHSVCYKEICVLMDGAGRTLAMYRGFDSLEPFERGIAVFRSGGLKGAIDSTGRVIIKGRFDSIESRTNGLIEAVERSSGLKGAAERITFFDYRGGIVRLVEPKGVEESLFSSNWSGLPAVERCTTMGCTTTFVDNLGRAGPAFSRFGQVADAAVAIGSMSEEKVGLVDRQLGWIGGMGYDYIIPIAESHGFLLAGIGERRTVFDRAGVQLVPLERYARIGAGPSGTLIGTVTHDGQCATFLRDGSRLKVPTTHCLSTDEHAASVGYVVMTSPQGMYAADLHGSPLSSQHMARIRPLNRAMMSCTETDGSMSGHVRAVALAGRKHPPGLYQELRAFRLLDEGPLLSDDLLIAKSDNEWGVIDSEGRWVLPARYTRIVPLGPKLLNAQEGVNWSVLDLRGNRMADPAWVGSGSQKLADGTLIFPLAKDGRWGVMDGNGRWRMDPVFDQVGISHGAVIVGERNKQGEMAHNLFDMVTGQMTFKDGFRSILAREDGLLEAIDRNKELSLLRPDGSVLAKLPCVPRTSRGMDNECMAEVSVD